ncbi:hypothetical protein [Streptomyces sp. NPDC020817]|uniref:hypothetical protein n=1 Tax=Streptomyces sp. NPDC020817 TaxID=3365095 RepID=UPI0037A1D312
MHLVVLGSAVARHLPEIRRMFPSAVGASPWQFIETGPGDGVWDKRRDAGPRAGCEPGMRFTRIVPGAQLIHGINPVHQGRCRKFITGLSSGR